MRGWSRAGSTLLGAAVAGFLLWVAAQWGHGSTGGYWAAYGVVAGAGLVFGMSQLRGRDGHPRATLTLAFLPVLVVAGWILLAGQPHPNWFRGHVLAWSGDIHVRGIVQDLTTWLGVLAFGIGAVLGVALEPRTVGRRRTVETTPTTTTPATTPAFERSAADEPLTAERHEVADAPAVQRTTETETTPRV